MLFYLKFFMFRLSNMSAVYPDPSSEFGVADSVFTNVLFFACWTNDNVNEVSAVKSYFGFKKELFTNVFKRI